MTNQKFTKLKRFANLASMLFIVLFGFSLLVADSQGEGLYFSLDESWEIDEVVHTDFSLAGDIYHYNDSKEEKLKEDEVTITVSIYLLEDDDSFKEVYTNNDYKISIDGKRFELYFIMNELQLDKEFYRIQQINDMSGKTTEYVNFQMKLTVTEDNPSEDSYDYSTITTISFKYSPESK